MREEKCRTGTFLLELIKNKMMTLPTDKSGTEFAEVLSEIQEKWLNFVKRSVLDYREVTLTLARSFLWRELKKCMSEDPKVAAKRISSADIDAVFANVTEDPGFSAVEEQTSEKDHKPSHSNQALKINGNHRERKPLVIFALDHIESLAFQNQTGSAINHLLTKGTKFHHQTAIAHSFMTGFLLCTAHKFYNCCGEVDAEDKSSRSMADTKLADPPINMAENENKRGKKVENFEIDLNSDSPTVQSGVTGVKYQSSMANESSASYLLGSVL